MAKQKCCFNVPWSTKEENKFGYDNYFLMLLEIALNSIEWVNLPPEIDCRFLEYQLNLQGYCLFSREDVINQYMVTQAAIGGKLDIYNIPKTRRAYAANGYQAQKTEENSVIIFNNYMRTPTIPMLQYYAQKLFDFDRSIDVNAAAQKTPYFIKCEESQRLTFKNLYAQVAANEPVIYADKALMNGLDVFRTDAPYVCDKLYDLKRKYWYECLTLLGVDTANTEKKERLTNVEIESYNSITFLQRQIRLNARKQAAEQINAMFGLNVDVKYREEQTNVAMGGVEDE